MEMVYTCYTPNCTNAARQGLNGLCMVCATRKVREKHGIKTEEKRPSPKAEPEEEKQHRCSRCKRVRPDRFNYKLDLCNSCAVRHYREAKLAKAQVSEVKSPAPEAKSPVSEKPTPRTCACGAVENRNGNRHTFFRKGKCRKCYESERWQKRKKLKHLKEGAPICGLPIYHITVDFSKYPKIHERLLRLAEAEMRTPGAQLLYLLKDNLAIQDGEK